MSRRFKDLSESNFEMSKSSLKMGNYICINNCERLLDTTLLILNNSVNLNHALGLYTFAVEEFGKAILLKDCLKDTEDKQYVPKIIFGGPGTHKQKFNRALKNLPDECKKIMVGIKLAFPSGKDFELELGLQGEKLHIPKNISGTFLTDVLTKMDVRMRCFYVDWDMTSNDWIKWRTNLQTDHDTLEKAVKVFKQIIPSQRILKTD